MNSLRLFTQRIPGRSHWLNLARASLSTQAQGDELASVPRRVDPSSAPNMMDIGVRRIFSPDHDMFRSSVRRFMQDVLEPNILKYEEQGFVDRELWLKAGETGLLGIDAPEEYGGSGGKFIDYAILLEENAYINDSSFGQAVSSGIVIPYLAEYGTEEQKQKYIPDMCLGKKVGCIAMTEPSAGSDLQGIRTYAKEDGDDYILNGSKVFITNGQTADFAMVAAITDPGAKNKAQAMSLLLVDSDTPGFRRGARPLRKMGMHGQDTAELFFDDVRVPKTSVLGQGGFGFLYMMKELPRERLIVAVLSTAFAEWMFETTREYVKQRKAFGRTVADLQVIQHRLAELKTRICVTRAFIDQCIVAIDEGTLDSQTASMAKVVASDLAYEVGDACVQMHGGWGYMYEYPISRAFTAARAMRIYAGTNEIMKELIARTIVKG